MIFAGFLALSPTQVDSIEMPLAPTIAISPMPALELLLPVEPEVSQHQTAEAQPTIVGMNENVRRAIWNATHTVGIESTYLVVVAAQESSFDPRRHAHRTSAMGLYQFTADTWLRSVRAFGAKHGLGEYARQIVVDRRGVVSMHDSAARTRLLRLRADPRISALMAAELARDNKARLERILDRPVTPAEIYMAHFLGVVQAARVIETARSAPHTPGVRLLPASARANPAIFKPLGRIASARAIVDKIAVYYQRQEMRIALRVGTRGSGRSLATGVTPDSPGSVLTRRAISIGGVLPPMTAPAAQLWSRSLALQQFKCRETTPANPVGLADSFEWRVTSLARNFVHQRSDFSPLDTSVSWQPYGGNGTRSISNGDVWPEIKLEICEEEEVTSHRKAQSTAGVVMVPLTGRNSA
jgi:Transglycosylase SLT domain